MSALILQVWAAVFLVNFSFLHVSSQFCGYGPLLATGRIIGGERALPGQVPWQASMQAFGTHYCGASILNDRWILTAAHCAAAVEKQELSIVVGTINLSSFMVVPHRIFEQRLAVDLIITHENFNRRQLISDVAVVRLNGRIAFNNHVQAVCLPQEGQDFVGEMGTVSGWGKMLENETTFSPLLNVVELPIITNRDCQLMYGLRIPPKRVVIRNEWICAGFREAGRDGCQGDSGGPITVHKNGTWTIVGITSGGFGCGFSNSPGIFTRLSQFSNWIKEKIAVNL